MKIRLSRTWQVAQFEPYQASLEEEIEGTHDSELIQKRFLDLAYEAHLAHDNYLRKFVKGSKTEEAEMIEEPPEEEEPEKGVSASVVLAKEPEKGEVPEGLSKFDLDGARERVSELIKEVGPMGKEISERYYDMNRTDFSRLTQHHAQVLMRLLQKELDDKSKET